jgi:hypothetical protein
MALEAADRRLNGVLIREKCLQALRLANVENRSIDLDIYRYFDDFDIRLKDEAYYMYQTQQIKQAIGMA